MQKYLWGAFLSFVLFSVILLTGVFILINQKVELVKQQSNDIVTGSRTQDSGWQKTLLSNILTGQLDDDITQVDLQGANIINGGSVTTTNITVTGTSTLTKALFGPLNFADDSGMQSWVDLSVTSASANNATSSYTAQIDGVKFLTIAALSNGSGGIKNHNMKFGRANSSTVIYVGTADGCSAYVYAVSTTNPTPTATSTSNCN